MPRYYLFGLYRVPMYEWYWGHTAAQIELIDIDQPLTVYKSHKHDAKPGQQGFKKTAAEAARDYEQWKSNKDRLDKKMGRKIDLGYFLSTGQQKDVGV